MNRQFLLLLILVTLSFTAGGATCRGWARPAAPLAPVVFVSPPTLQDVISAVNANTMRVRQLQTDSASLTVAGLPPLRASIALEQPRRFRLQAKVFAPELDLGSNDELFWFWAKSDPQKSLYYARHGELRHGPRLLPIEPQWLVQAFGLVMLTDEALHEGPYPRGDGQVEIRSHLQGASGRLVRALVVDQTYGWIVEQQIADEQGRLLAQVRASEHRHDPITGATLPHRIAVNLPLAQLSWQIDVAEYSINQLYSDPVELWSLPRMEGYDLVDLSQLGSEATAPLPWAPPATRSSPPQPGLRSGFRPSYRGYTR